MHFAIVSRIVPYLHIAGKTCKVWVQCLLDHMVTRDGSSALKYWTKSSHLKKKKELAMY